MEDANELPIIGRNALVTIVGHAKKVPAKIDTGADSSAVWASNIRISEAGHLHFVLFAKESKFFNGEEIITDDFTVAQVKSSTGHIQIRYRARLVTRMAGRRVKVLFNLSDRSQNDFPILIGRRTLSGKFRVDVTIKEHRVSSGEQTKKLREELTKDPHAFHKKYHDTN